MKTGAMRAVLLAVAALAVAIPAPVLRAKADAGPFFQMDYSNPGLMPSHWVMTLHPDGSGHFFSERGNAPMDASAGFQAANVDRDIQVSAEFAGRVFETIHQHKNLNLDCESHMNVAFQGWKKLTYNGPDGTGSCTFNYAKDKAMESLGSSLVAVADAIEEGARLEILLQHDRLGLDKEMEYLMEASADGRVQQICTIRGILQRLADDPDVMERVRKRARVLLARSEG
jgi:hypothetical protein